MSTTDESLGRAEELLARLEAARASSRRRRAIRTRRSTSSTSSRELAKEVEAEIERATERGRCEQPDELRALVEDVPRELALWPRARRAAGRDALRARGAASGCGR